MPEEQSQTSAKPHAFFETLKRPASMNHWLIAPPGFPGKPNEPAPDYMVPAERLSAAFEEAIGALRNVREKSRDGALTHYIAQTAALRFKDDIRVQFLSLGPRASSLAIYSASRIGFTDLGANRRRLGQWLVLLGEKLA